MRAHSEILKHVGRNKRSALRHSRLAEVTERVQFARAAGRKHLGRLGFVHRLDAVEDFAKIELGDLNVVERKTAEVTRARGRNKRSALRHSRVAQVTDRVEFARAVRRKHPLPHGRLTVKSAAKRRNGAMRFAYCALRPVSKRHSDSAAASPVISTAMSCSPLVRGEPAMCGVRMTLSKSSSSSSARPGSS